MITIVDFRMGNLGNVRKAFQFIGAEAKIASRRDDIRKAEKLVIPGVGAFGKAMSNLKRSGLHKLILEMAEKEVPLLGICLGMQILLETGKEGGNIKGLGLIPGKVRRFEVDLKVPHIGWNQIHIKKDSGLLSQVPDKSYYYFVHSYYAEPDNGEHILCTTDYGVEFVSGIAKDNVYGFQFHPEKSQNNGLQILRNFSAL
jgi:glutamine amidotransferase